jgi:exportin-5
VGTIFVHTLKKIVILILALHYILLMTCSDTHNRCSFLLSSSDFRLHACEVFKLVCSRKRPSDASTAEFDSAISNLFQILTNASREFLCRSSSSSSVIDDNDYDFAVCMCESMASLGSTNLQSISSDGGVMAVYLQQVLISYF